MSLDDDALEKIRDEILEGASEAIGVVPAVQAVKLALENGLSADAGDIYVTWLLVDSEGNVLRQHVDTISVNGSRGDAVPFLGSGDAEGQERVLERLPRARDQWLRLQRERSERVF